MQWYYTPVARQRGKRSWQEHTKLINAIEKGDGEGAARIMREHTERTRQTYLDLRDKEGETQADQQVLSLTTGRRRAPRS